MKFNQNDSNSLIYIQVNKQSMNTNEPLWKCVNNMKIYENQ